MVYNWVRMSGEGQQKASEKAETFLKMIQDPRRRIYYAEKFQNYDVAMDVSDVRVSTSESAVSPQTIAGNLRDRVQLEQLRRRIPQDHPSYHRATALLEVNDRRASARCASRVLFSRIPNGEINRMLSDRCST